MVGPGCHQNSGPGGPQSPTKCAGDLCAVSSLERLLGRLHTTAVNALFCTILWVFVWAYSLAWLLSSVALCEPSAPPCQPMPTDYAGSSEYPDYAGMTPGSIVQTLGVASCGTASCHGGPIRTPEHLKCYTCPARGGWRACWASASRIGPSSAWPAIRCRIRAGRRCLPRCWPTALAALPATAIQQIGSNCIRSRFGSSFPVTSGSRLGIAI